jgi:hypothetical protein
VILPQYNQGSGGSFAAFSFGPVFFAARFFGISVIGLWPVTRDPRSAATKLFCYFF